MPTFQTAEGRVQIGTKAEFIKLQAKHAVVGSDADDIRKVVEKIEKIVPDYPEIRRYVAPYGELRKAVSSFKTKYGKKHPKFIASVDATFVDPIEKIIDEGRDWIKRTATLPKYYLEVLDPLEDLVKVLDAKILDDSVLNNALVALAGAASSYNNATSNFKLLAVEFKMEKLAKIGEASEKKRGLLNSVDRSLQEMKASKAYDTNLLPIVANINEIAHTCQVLATALDKEL